MNSRSWPMPTSSARRQPPPARGVGHEAAVDLLVDLELLAVGLELCRRQRLWVAAEEQLQRGRVAHLLELASGLREPALQRLAAALGERVDAPAAAALLAALAQEALAG